MTSKAIALQLGRSGLCVSPGFLSPKSLCATADDLDFIRSGGRFNRAGIGRGPGRSIESGVRNDETYWLDRNFKSLSQNLIWRKLDLLKAAINRSLFLGLNDFEGHYAVFPQGGFYKRHKDCFHGDSGRIVSFILYLNRDWRYADGGRLRVYDDRLEGLCKYTDVDPIGGTMVCFLSEDTEHEVLLSRAPRFSLSGWFKRTKTL